MFIGNVLTRTGYKTPRPSENIVAVAPHKHCAVIRVPHAGDVMYITTSRSDHPLVVTDMQFIMTRTEEGRPCWKRAKYVREGEYVGSLIPLIHDDTTYDTCESKTIDDHQLDSISAGILRKISNGKLGDIIPADKGFVDGSYVWYRVEGRLIRREARLLNHAKFAICDGVAMIDFP
jgi:hypothetical protein